MSHVLFVLIPGAGGHAGYWSELVPQLESRGYDAVAVDIPEDDPALGLPEYADAVETAIDHALPRGVQAGDDGVAIVLVAQSMGGFTAPMVRRPVDGIVLLNAMIPLPGETPGDWWEATGQPEAMRASDAALGYAGDGDPEHYFLHDLPADIRRRLLEGGDRAPSETPFAQRCAFEQWPDAPLLVLAGADDRMFPAGFQEQVARERLGLPVEILPGGHLLALSQPVALADRLAEFASSLRPAPPAPAP